MLPFKINLVSSPGPCLQRKRHPFHSVSPLKTVVRVLQINKQGCWGRVHEASIEMLCVALDARRHAGTQTPTMPAQPGWHCVIPLEKAFRRGCLFRGDNWQEAWRLFMQNNNETCSQPMSGVGSAQSKGPARAAGSRSLGNGAPRHLPGASWSSHDGPVLALLRPQGGEPGCSRSCSLCLCQLSPAGLGDEVQPCSLFGPLLVMDYGILPASFAALRFLEGPFL